MTSVLRYVSYYEKMFECGPSTKQRHAFIQSYNYVVCVYNNNNNNNDNNNNNNNNG